MVLHRIMAEKKEKHSQYFEGTMQLREPTKEVTDYFNKLISEKKVRIAKIVKLKTGKDYYLDNNKAMLAIGKKLFERFGGELKTSRKLYTVKRQTSKKVYRVTVMFRPPKFKKGDIVNYRGSKLEVVMLKKQVLGKDIESGKKVWFNYEEAR